MNKTEDFSRREFIKATSLSASFIGLGGLSLQSCTRETSSVQSSDLFEIFKDPKAEARPFFRWWWNGNCVTRKEITRELEIIKNAGAGGVEINPIAMPDQVENPPEGLIWLSVEWCNMLIHAAKESKRLGLISDLIVGTGWPFGGEFIEPEETLQGLVFETMEMKGPGTKLVRIEMPNDENEKIIKINLIPKGLKDIEMARELTNDVQDNGDLRIDLDTGIYVLIKVRWRNRFRTVYHGAPGGAGAVLDHFNQQAVRKYLLNMSDKLNLYFEGNIGESIRALFCDSIELQGANWTDDLKEEFIKRRGYDIDSYLPLIHIDNKFIDPNLDGTLRRVRYDFSLTLAELFIDRFIKPYHEWCAANNTLSRYQAYGHPWLYTDMIDGYMVTDIPEGDQWLYNPGWSLAEINEIRYGIWNKYASSGGHLAGKKIVSSEAMTNLRGVFRASLEYIKQATDLNFVAGINHLVLHGYNFSPPEAGFPGWIRYGTYFNENNTWWKYFPLWSSYAARISTVLQNTTPVSQVAILGPTADIWSDSGLDRNPFNMNPWYLHSFWQALNHNGMCSDYINRNVIMNMEINNGKMIHGQMSYDILILCNIRTIDPEVLYRINEFKRSGGKVILIGEKPVYATGLKDASKRDKQVQKLSDQLFEDDVHFIEAPDQDTVDPHQGLADWTKQLSDKSKIESGITITPNDAALFYIQRKSENLDLFFFANSDPERPLNLILDLKISGKSVWRWCPETLDRKMLVKDSARPLNLALAPLESALLILDASKEGLIEEKVSDKKTEPLELSGNWKVNCKHNIDHTEFNTELNELMDLSGLQELNDFSGEISYSLHFNLQELNYKQIDLGEVFDIADVWLNDKPVGVRWYGNRPLSIPEGILKGQENILTVHVTNRLYNYCASLNENPTANHWISMNKYPSKLPAGLIGPVILS
jgi:hypothetical protein